MGGLGPRKGIGPEPVQALYQAELEDMCQEEGNWQWEEGLHDEGSVTNRSDGMVCDSTTGKALDMPKRSRRVARRNWATCERCTCGAVFQGPKLPRMDKARSLEHDGSTLTKATKSDAVSWPKSSQEAISERICMQELLLCLLLATYYPIRLRDAVDQPLSRVGN